MWQKFLTWLNDFVHNYKFAVGVAGLLFLALSQAYPELANLVSEDMILQLLLLLLGIGAAERYAYDRVQLARGQKHLREFDF